MTREDAHLHAVGARAAPDAQAAHAGLEDALFEVKRVIVGQESMLERVIVALLAGGHVLLEGVRGLAKTLTVKTVADALGGTFKRLQFTPDRKSTRLNSSHANISYAVFCLKKKKKNNVVKYLLQAKY